MIDAFVALLVISTGLIMVFSLNSFSPSISQPELLSQEFVTTLVSIQVNELNNDFIARQIKNSNITNTDNTVMQQAYEFKKYHSDPVTGLGAGYNFSTWLLSNVSSQIIPEQYSYEIIIDGNEMHGRSAKNKNESELLLSSKRIIFGVVNRSVEFWGPVQVEVIVWQ